MLKTFVLAAALSTAPTQFISFDKLIEPVKTEKPAPAPEGRKKRPKKW